MVRCSYKEEQQALKQTSPPFTPSELTLPLASQSSPSPSPSSPFPSSSPSPSPSPLPSPSDHDTEAKPAEAAVLPLKNDDLFSAASQTIEKMTVSQLALYGGLVAGGLYLVESILSSFDVLPLLPETLQIVGVLYTILLASRLFQGKPLSLTPSPVKAITELVERRGTMVQRTNLELPQDLDVRVLATMEKLSRERDDAVNKMENLRRRTADYARVVAEKEALETVAMQLAQERDEAMSEVIALKQAVDAMSDRMRTIEKTLQQELEPLKQSSRALETVALQLASERETALKELSELKEELALAKCKEEEKTALESVASQLAGERDQANSENERLKKILADLQTEVAPVPGLSPEQELFLKAHIDAAGLQFVDLAKPYEDQKEEIDKFVSHLVDEYGAPPGWTSEYLKRFLEESTSKSKTDLEISSSSSHSENESPL